MKKIIKKKVKIERIIDKIIEEDPIKAKEIIEEKKKRNYKRNIKTKKNKRN